MTIVEKLKAPAPKFFRVLCILGLALVAAGVTIIAAPIAWPPTVLTAAGHLSLAGAVAAVVSMAAAPDDPGNNDDNSSPLMAASYGTP